MKIYFSAFYKILNTLHVPFTFNRLQLCYSEQFRSHLHLYFTEPFITCACKPSLNHMSRRYTPVRTITKQMPQVDH